MKPTLADLQNQFQTDILSGSDRILPKLKVPANAARKSRLSVYQNAYRLRLVGILEEEYPVLCKYLGQADFWLLADRFIKAMPSHHPNARMFPVRLPDFMANDAKVSDRPEAVDLAALENALSRAFDARDADIVEMNALTALPAEHIAALEIAFGPSVASVPMSTNAERIYAALSDGEDPPKVRQLEERANILVWRQEMGAKYRAIGAEEAMLVAEIKRGKDFGVLCAMAAVMDDAETAPARIAGYLTQWISAGMISALTVPETA